MNKLKDQRKITHRAQKNPRKSDLITVNKHRRKFYEEAELQKMKIFITWPITQTSAEAHHIIHEPIISHGLLTLDITLVSLLRRCFHSHAIFDSKAIRTKYGPAKNRGRGGEGEPHTKMKGIHIRNYNQAPKGDSYTQYDRLLQSVFYFLGFTFAQKAMNPRNDRH